MADLLHGLDPGKLVLAGAVLSFIISPFEAPPYNLPIFLFGALIHESSDAVQSLKLFTGILSASIIYDIVWVFQEDDQGGFSRFLLFLLWLLKFPTTLTFLSALRQRGSQFMGLGADVSGPTVWSMPGGLTSTGRDGYQIVDDEPRSTSNVSTARYSQPQSTAPPPKSAMATTAVPNTTAGAQTTVPGTYQNV